MRERFQIVIVGGGFAGVALAARLIRCAQPAVGLTLIEAAPHLGAGTPGSASRECREHGTNVGRLSLFGDDPQHFARWQNQVTGSEATEPGVDPYAYGDYLRDSLVETISLSARSDMQVMVRTQLRVVDVASMDGEFGVALEDGRTLRADAVVLATGASGVSCLPGPVDGSGPDRTDHGRALERRLVARGLLSPNWTGTRFRGSKAASGCDAVAECLFVTGISGLVRLGEHGARADLRSQADFLAAALMDLCVRRRRRAATVLPFHRPRRAAQAVNAMQYRSTRPDTRQNRVV